MKRVIQMAVVATAAAQLGCTTLQPIEASPEEVQQLLVAEDVVKPGDRVRIVTKDEVVHEFRVTELDHERGLILGKNQSVLIADIIALDTRNISVGRTTLLAGGIGIGLAALIAVAIAPAIILSGG